MPFASAIFLSVLMCLLGGLSGIAEAGEAEPGTQEWRASERVNFLPLEIRDNERGELFSTDLQKHVGGSRALPHDCRVYDAYFRLKALLDRTRYDSLYRMKSLNLLSFFPDRTIAGATYRRLRGTSELKKIMGAIYKQIQNHGTALSSVPSPYLRKGHERDAVFRYADQGGGGSVRIPFPQSQEEAVRRALIAAAEKERDRLESLVKAQQRAVATKQGLEDLIGALETSREVFTLRARGDNAISLSSLGITSLRPPKTEVPVDYWRDHGGVPRSAFVDSPANVVLFQQYGCYLNGLYWRQHGAEIGHRLSEAEQRALFTPPLTRDDLKRSAKVLDDLAEAENKHRQWVARQPSMRALPKDARPVDDSGSHGHWANHGAELPQIMRSNSLARDLRGRSERYSRPFETEEFEIELGD
jgi:hypothetical protein